MNNKVFCIGELLVDMVCIDGLGLKDGVKFEKKAGGAPANVSAAISKLGGSSVFLGQVGDDFFGEFLIDTLRKVNVVTEMTIRGGATTIALVGIDKNGERNFNFLRGSDEEYSFDNIDLNMIGKLDIIHFGSATALLGGNLRDTYFKLLNYAKDNNIYVSFDPNYRDVLIKKENLQSYLEDIKLFLSSSDFVKLSDEEASLITGESDVYKSLEKLSSYGAKVICITLGSKGSLLSAGGESIVIPSIEIDQVDSTGAGDAFVGAVLSKISRINNRREVSLNTWIDIIGFANKVGAITCTKYGAIDSIPFINEL